MIRTVFLGCSLASASVLLPVPCPAAASGSDIPFELAARVILLKGSVNDSGPHTFILDTGATETVITPPTARALGLKGLPAGGAQKIAVANSLTVGSATVRNLPIYIFDPSQALSLRLDHGINYHGFLGHSFLSQFVVTINYRDKVVRLVNAEDDKPVKETSTALARPGERIPFELVDRQILLKGFVNGQGPVRLLLDTGSAETVLLPRVARALNIRGVAAPQQPGAAFATAESIAVADAKVANVPVVIYTPVQELGRKIIYDGILGFTFLSRYTVTIHYGQRFVTLARADEQPAH